MSKFQAIFRATDNIKTRQDKENPDKIHGFQVCGLTDESGMVSRTELYFDGAKQKNALAPGEYFVTGRPYISRDGKLRFAAEYAAVPAGK